MRLIARSARLANALGVLVRHISSHGRSPWNSAKHHESGIQSGPADRLRRGSDRRHPSATRSTFSALPGLRSIVAMAYGIGGLGLPHQSGGELRRAGGSMTASITYVIAQVLGAIAGAAVLVILRARPLAGGRSSNGWGSGYLGEYDLGLRQGGRHLPVPRLLGVTQKGTSALPFAIGLTWSRSICSASSDRTRILPTRPRAAVCRQPACARSSWLFIVAPLIGAVSPLASDADLAAARSGGTRMDAARRRASAAVR